MAATTLMQILAFYWQGFAILVSVDASAPGVANESMVDARAETYLNQVEIIKFHAIWLSWRLLGACLADP